MDVKGGIKLFVGMSIGLIGAVLLKAIANDSGLSGSTGTIAGLFHFLIIAGVAIYSVNHNIGDLFD